MSKILEPWHDSRLSCPPTVIVVMTVGSGQRFVGKSQYGCGFCLGIVYNNCMDKLIKQSIDARKNAFSASYKIDAEMQKRVDALFADINKLGEKCKDAGEFETEFQKSPLNQKYLDLFTEIATKCAPNAAAPEVDTSNIGKAIAGGVAAGALESVADDALSKAVPTRAAVHQKAYDEVRKIPGVGDAIDVAEKASYGAHLSKLFGRKKK